MQIIRWEVGTHHACMSQQLILYNILENINYIYIDCCPKSKSKKAVRDPSGHAEKRCNAKKASIIWYVTSLVQ